MNESFIKVSFKEKKLVRMFYFVNSINCEHKNHCNQINILMYKLSYKNIIYILKSLTIQILWSIFMIVDKL